MNKRLLILTMFGLCVSSAYTQTPSGACDLPTPVLFAEPLTCRNPSTQLYFAALPYHIRCEWSGNGLEPNQPTPPVVSEPGWYYVRCTEMNTGCSRLDSIFVPEYKEIPLAMATVAENHSDYTYSIALDASLSTKSPDILYHWWTEDKAAIVSSEDHIKSYVSQPCVVFLRVTNRSNGCSNVSKLDLKKAILEGHLLR